MPHRPSVARPDPTLLALAAAGATTLAVSGVIAATRNGGHGFDAPLRRLVGAAPYRAPRRMRSKRLQALAGVGGKWPTLAAGAVVTGAVGARSGARPALPLLAAAVAGFGLHGVMKLLVPRDRPFGSRLTGKHTNSFPSGHASRAAAVYGALAHVAVREGLVSRAVAYPLVAASALASGSARVAQDRHWASDIVGGLGLGVAVAALCGAWYDHAMATSDR